MQRARPPAMVLGGQRATILQPALPQTPVRMVSGRNKSNLACKYILGKSHICLESIFIHR